MDYESNSQGIINVHIVDKKLHNFGNALFKEAVQSNEKN